MARARVFWLLGGLLLFSFWGNAQQPALRVYSIQDGLKYSQVFSVFQDHSGFLWAGTSYGISRYDGREFRTLTRAHGLPHDSVYAVGEDGAGFIWVLTQEGLAKISPQRGTEGAPEVVQTDAFLKPIDGPTLWRMQTAGDVLWLLGTDGLFRVKGQKAEKCPLPDDLKLAKPFSLGPVRENDAWFCAASKTVHFTVGQKPQVFDPVPELGPPVAVSIHSGEVFLLQKDGLSRLQGSVFAKAPEWRLPRGTNPGGLTPFGDRLIVRTQARGITILERGKDARFYSREEGLPSSTVNDVLLDRDGLLWLGTEDGLVKIFDFSVESYPSRPPEMGASILSISEDSKGRLWIGHSDGVTLLASGQATRFDPFPFRDEENSVWGVLPLESGPVLLGTKGGLLALFPESPPRTSPPLLEGNDRVYGLLKEPGGSIWASTMNGLVQFFWDEKTARPRDIRFHREVNGQPVGETRGLSLAPDGTLWIGTDGGGLLRWDGSRLDRFGNETGLPSGVCRTVLGLSQDEVLVGTDIGLFTFSKGKTSPLEDINKRFEKPYVVSLQRSPSGSVWVALTDRLVELRNGVIERVIDRATGLAGSSTTAENCLFLAASGRLWLGMVGGVTSIDLSRPLSRGSVPEVLLLSVTSKHGAAIAPGATLPYKLNTLTFSYRSPTYLAEELTQFTESLHGYEDSFGKPHSTPAQRYTNLPAGRYKLEVRAISAAGIISEPVFFPFSIAPPWWQTLWAQAGFLAVLLALGYAAVLLRTSRIRQHAEVLKRKVAEQTRELASANRKLEEAQEQLERLLGSSERAHEDVAAWAKASAMELCKTVKAREISVQLLEGDRTTSLAGSISPSLGPGVLDQLASGLTRIPAGDEVHFPVRSAQGDILGVLSVSGHAEEWEEPETRLITAFAHQLGGALDLRRMQKQVEKAALARSAIRKDLEKKGISTVALCPRCKKAFSQGLSNCTEDGSVLEPLGLLPLKLYDRYRLERLLGQGGMGMVFLASDEQLGRDVAIKIIRPERFDDPGVKMRFEREARATARVQHRGVISIFDTGQLDDGSAFIVMERLKGLDLATVLERCGRGTPHQIASVATQTASALAAAHRAEIIHRDIKPENLFLLPGADGFSVKIVDFGLARSFAASEALTQTGVVVGTPAYMSPEQVRGLSVGASSDIYSLAVSLWEALTGWRLVTNSGLGDIFMEILYMVPPSLSLMRPSMSAEVDALFREALNKEPSMRVADVEEWALRLSAALAEVTDTEQGWPPDLWETPGASPARRSPAPTSAQTHPAGLVPG